MVLGGTAFLGRYVVEAALAKGCQVSLFNRGRSNPDLFPGVHKLRGDRDGDLSALKNHRWDWVIDTSGYLPRVIRASAQILRDVDHYTFISTASVYADVSQPGTDEKSPVAVLEDESVEELRPHFGALKALCERVLESEIPERVLNVRPGFIVGPHDPYNRLTYWVARIAAGGEVLAPKPRTQQVQFIDVRDLAEWILRMADKGKVGTYNTAGPTTETELDMQGLLRSIKGVTRSDARLTWVDESFIIKEGVKPWSDLPFWLAPNSIPSLRGFCSIDSSRAVDHAGLSFRPVGETIRDVFTWIEGGRIEVVRNHAPLVHPAGLDAEK